MSNTPNTPSLPTSPKGISLLAGGIALVAAAGFFAVTGIASKAPVEVASSETAIQVAMADEQMQTRRGLRNAPFDLEPAGDTELLDDSDISQVVDLQATTDGMVMTRRGMRSAPPVGQTWLTTAAVDQDGLVPETSRGRH